MPPSSFNPLPTCPIPIQWDVPGRIAELQAMIDDPATSEPQKINLQAAIDLYHRKELPGPVVIIQDGKVISLKDFNINRPWWSKAATVLISALLAKFLRHYFIAQELFELLNPRQEASLAPPTAIP